MAAVAEVKFVAVPGADDVHVVLVEGLTEMHATLADLVDHLRHTKPLASWAALVRAQVAVGVIPITMADDADLLPADRDQPHAAFGDLAVFTDQNFRHCSCASLRFRTDELARLVAAIRMVCSLSRLRERGGE